MTPKSLDNTTNVVGEILARKIGDMTVTLRYDKYHPDARKYANEKLDKEQAAYEEALEVVGNGLNYMVEQLERTHLRLEDIRQNTCSNCGLQTLKERRNRMRVFGGLFWTNSEPSPYKRCSNCGHDQEHNQFHPPHLESIKRQAERRIENAHRLIGKYTAPKKGSSK